MKFKSLVSNLRLVLMPDSSSVVNGVVIKDSGVTLCFENCEFDLNKFIQRIEIDKPHLVETESKRKAFIDNVVNRIKTCSDFVAGKVWEYKILTAEERAEALRKQWDAQFDMLDDADKAKFVKQFTRNIPGVSVRHIDTDIVEVVNRPVRPIAQPVVSKPVETIAPKESFIKKPARKK